MLEKQGNGGKLTKCLFHDVLRSPITVAHAAFGECGELSVLL